MNKIYTSWMIYFINRRKRYNNWNYKKIKKK